jgi:hypothetical protein
MSLRTCRVSCRDSRDVEHSVEVTAQSLYEAVAQALRVFRENDWREDTERDPAAVIVKVRQPEIEHRVRIGDFENWLDSAGKSPVEMALKVGCEPSLSGDLGIKWSTNGIAKMDEDVECVGGR